MASSSESVSGGIRLVSSSGLISRPAARTTKCYPFEALDIRVDSSHTAAQRRRELAERAAALYPDRGAELKTGLGVYSYPTPGTVHIDTGYRRRTWKDGRRFV